MNKTGISKKNEDKLKIYLIKNAHVKSGFGQTADNSITTSISEKLRADRIEGGRQ